MFANPHSYFTSAILGGLIAASIGCNGQPKTANIDCGGEKRISLNCESEFKYDALKLGGGFQAMGVGVNASTETTALRQIDTETERYAAQARRLCEEYNACVLDKDTYSTRAENMRRRMSKVPELLDSVQHASGDSARAKAVADAYQTLVPDEQRVELQMDFSVMAQRPSESRAAAIRPGDTLPTGTRVSFVVKTSRQAYVYLFQRSPDASVNVLFPDTRIQLTNPIPASQPLRIPSGEASFRLNDKDIGEEKVFLAASLQPLASMQQAVGQVSAGQGKVAVLETLSTIPPSGQDSGCKTRALELEPSGGGGCVRSRGLELDSPAGPSPETSMRIRTEAADSTIVGVFKFQHTR
jgi:hypothetical protein